MNHRDQSIAILQATAADLRANLDRINDAIVVLQGAADAPCAVTYIDPRFAHCLSRGVPEGRDTVLGYLAKHHPEMLELMDFDRPCATARDGFWLAHRWKQVEYVPAPDVLRAKGILRVRCWPVALLERRFG
jgi:hypothetical protein